MVSPDLPASRSAGRQSPHAVLSGLVVAVLFALAACGGSDTVTKAEVTRWLRISGGGDDSEEVVECLSNYMYEELTQEELRTWISLDPAKATAEQVQRLPRAIEVADHCRGVAGYGRRRGAPGSTATRAVLTAAD